MYKVYFLCIATASLTIQCADSVNQTSQQLLPEWVTPAVKRLVLQPLQVLDENIEGWKEFRNVIEAFPTNPSPEQEQEHWAALCEKKDEIEKRNKFFSLRECATKCCILSRSIIPLFRKTFENIVAKSFTEKSRISQNGMRYISFAGGSLFFDTVILSKILIKNPTQNITICTIDTCQADYVKLQNCNEITTPTSRDEAIKSEKIKHLTLREKADYLLDDTCLNQFASFLKTNFPKAKLTFYAYGSTEAYLANQPQGAEDCFIVAADCDAPEDLNKLIEKSLEINKNTSAYELLKICNSNGVTGTFTLIKEWPNSEGTEPFKGLKGWECKTSAKLSEAAEQKAQ